jgi:hemerythrin-like domain-containing protein
MTATLDIRPRTDVHDMVVVHRVFRRELVALPVLVRGVPAGDASRAATVAEHARLLLTGLHIHHTGEDEALWPLLHERAAGADALLATMEAQHAHVHEGIETAFAQLDTWTVSVSPGAGEELAATLDTLREHLVEHLDREEREVLPLAARHLSAAEWQAVGEHGRDAMSRAQLPLMFGAILEDADAEERDAIYAAVPGPVRLFLRTIGARTYRRYIARVRDAG